VSNEAIAVPDHPGGQPTPPGQGFRPDASTQSRGRRMFDGLKRFIRTEPTGAVSLLLIMVFVVVALFAPVVSPHDPLFQNRTELSQPPGGQFLLGTDDIGRDVFSRVIYGARTSLIIGVVTTVTCLIIGTAMGIVSGFFGRKTDLILQRFSDAVQSVPPLVMLLFIATVLGPSIRNTIIALVIVITPGFNRVARGETLRIREESYIEAALATGTSKLKIMWRHVVPNLGAPMITLASLVFAGVIIAESALSFLGIGTPPPTPSWGRMLSDGLRYVERYPWMVLSPGIVLSLAVLAFNLLGDALRDFFDPKLSGR
jgi:peptide/nickel transport system permease protein